MSPSVLFHATYSKSDLETVMVEAQCEGNLNKYAVEEALGQDISQDPPAKATPTNEVEEKVLVFEESQVPNKNIPRGAENLHYYHDIIYRIYTLSEHTVRSILNDGSIMKLCPHLRICRSSALEISDDLERGSRIMILETAILNWSCSI